MRRKKGRHRSPRPLRRFAVLYAALAVVVAGGAYAVDAQGGGAQAAVTRPCPPASAQSQAALCERMPHPAEHR